MKTLEIVHVQELYITQDILDRITNTVYRYRKGSETENTRNREQSPRDGIDSDKLRRRFR